MMEQNASKDLTITVADPTQTQQTFKLFINGKYTAKQARYNQSKNQTEILITLPQKGEAGSSVTVELKRD